MTKIMQTLNNHKKENGQRSVRFFKSFLKIILSIHGYLDFLST